MPLDSSATATTATNSATYLVNSRLRIFLAGDGTGTACPAGDGASTRLSGVSGCAVMLIRFNLARTVADVSVALQQRVANRRFRRGFAIRRPAFRSPTAVAPWTPPQRRQPPGS